MTNSDDMTTVRFEDRPSGKLWRREPGTKWRELMRDLVGESPNGQAYGYGYAMGEADAVAGVAPLQWEELMAQTLATACAEGYSDGYSDTAPF